MISLFDLGSLSKGHRLGQFDILSAIPSLISAGAQAGATVYGANMQKKIAEIQKSTQEDIANKQAAAQQTQAQAQVQTAAIQAKAQAQAQAATPKILGIDQSTFIIGGVGVAVALGVIAMFATKSSTPDYAEATVTA